MSFRLNQNCPASEVRPRDHTALKWQPSRRGDIPSEVLPARGLYLVVVEMAVDRETMASDLPLVTGRPHIATATHPNIAACAHQLWGVLLHGLQAPGVWGGREK